VTTPLSDREYGVLAEFRRALRSFLKFSEGAARDAGLTPQQHQLLLVVRGFPDGAPAISDIAERLLVRHHSAVELVDRAEEAGLVRRRVDADDRRVQRIALTAAGERVLASLSALHRAELRAFRQEMAEILREL
jgi:DNA-binding MarR family transcriptional regulator